MKKLFLIFVFLVWPQFAGASTLAEIEQLYNNGYFEKAAKEGRALGTIEGLAVALRAQLVLVQYIYEPEERLDALAVAIADSEKATALDPHNIEIMVTSGILIGLRGRYDRSIADGKAARALFEAVLAKDPDQSWALGALGSWHAETISEAGGIAASLVMGAKKKLAWDNFNKSIEVEPTNLAIRAAHVRALFKVQFKKNAGRISQNIAYILKEAPDNFLEVIVIEQIKRIDEAWRNGDGDQLELLLKEAVSFQDMLPDDAG